MENNVVEITKDTVNELKETGVVEVAKEAAASTGHISVLAVVIAGLTAVFTVIGAVTGIKKIVSKIKSWKEARKIRKAEKEGFKVVDSDDYEEVPEENDGDEGNEEE